MFALLVLCSGVSALGGVAVGVAWMRATQTDRQTDPSHEHAWGMWEDCQLRQWNVAHTGSVLVDGQKRECITCCERQVREVST